MTDSAYLREAARRAAFDKEMRVSTSSRSFELRIAGDRIASISTRLEHQEKAAKTIARRYNSHDDLVAPYIAAQRASVDMPFDDWLIGNRVVFTNPYDTAGIKFFPAYAVLHSMPENRKSQFFYLRPDLGTIIYPFEKLHIIADLLDVRLGRTNESEDMPCPLMSVDAKKHMDTFFQWDYIAGGYPLPKGLQ